MKVNTTVEFEVQFEKTSSRGTYEERLVQRSIELFGHGETSRKLYGTPEAENGTVQGKVKFTRNIPTTEPVENVRSDVANEDVPKLIELLESIPYVSTVDTNQVQLANAEVE